MFGDQHAFPSELDFARFLERTVEIDRLELRRCEPGLFVRCGSGGQTGIFKINWVGAPLAELMVERIFPVWKGRDARELARLVRESYRANYKFHGPPLWSCIAAVEFAVLDLLGRIAGVSVDALLGGRLRDRVPFYLSYFSRESRPEEELELIRRQMEATGARAVKFKIGGRMGRAEGPVPGRSETLIRTARRVLGDGVVLYADGNSSYSAEQAITIGRLMQEEGFAMFEEPCPFEEYDQTRTVAAALEMHVSGGEQDCNLWQMRRMLEEDVVDVLQPDVMYAGGLLRCWALGRWAAACGKTVVPHSPRGDSELAAVLQFCAALPNLNPFIELPGIRREADWFDPKPRLLEDGSLAVPDGPGFGVSYGPEIQRD